MSIHCRLSLNSCFYVNKMKVRGKGNIIQPSQPRLKKTDFSIRDSAEHIMFTQSSSRYKDRIYCMLFQFDVKNGFIINNNLYAGECCRFLFLFTLTTQIQYGVRHASHPSSCSCQNAVWGSKRITMLFCMEHFLCKMSLKC